MVSAETKAVLEKIAEDFERDEILCRKHLNAILEKHPVRVDQLDRKTYWSGQCDAFRRNADHVRAHLAGAAQ